MSSANTPHLAARQPGEPAEYLQARVQDALAHDARTGELAVDQLIAANVREVYRARGNDLYWLERAAREVASLLKSDYERLMSVLLAIEPYDVPEAHGIPAAAGWPKQVSIVMEG